MTTGAICRMCTSRIASYKYENRKARTVTEKSCLLRKEVGAKLFDVDISPSFGPSDAAHSVFSCWRLPTSKFDRHIADHPEVLAFAFDVLHALLTGQVVGLHSHSDRFLDAERKWFEYRGDQVWIVSWLCVGHIILHGLSRLGRASIGP